MYTPEQLRDPWNVIVEHDKCAQQFLVQHELAKTPPSEPIQVQMADQDSKLPWQLSATAEAV